MPQYDESFILDDSANQRRNKRSYRVYKKGCCTSAAIANASPKISSIGGHGTYILKNNINNLKNREFGSNNTVKDVPKNNDVIYPKSINKSFPSLLEKDALFFNEDKYIFSPDSRDIYSKNNNYFSFNPGKSLENLANRNHFAAIKTTNCLSNGKSLQNLNDHIVKNNLPHKYHAKNTSGYLARARSKEQSASSSYLVNNGESNGKHKDKVALRLAARILESGVYRQLGRAKCEDNDDSGFAEDSIGVEGDSGGTPPSSGHKASFRSATKLARRARSFKEDLLERISAMSLRSQPQTISNRSQSPLSSKTRSQKVDDPEASPAKDLEVLVRQVRFDLKHFGDVISKKKLEMLPGNGTILLDTVTNIHTAIRPYVSSLGANPCEVLGASLSRLCAAVSRLIRLCDEGMLGGEECAALDSDNVQQVTKEVQLAVEELASLAFEKMGVNTSQMKSNGTTSTPGDGKGLKLQVRPAVDGVRTSTGDGQRNSLPDIPLTPRERSILEGTIGGLPVRSSHSTESILDSVVTTPHHPQPPPKPPRPVRSLDIAPPLPPKRKLENCLLGPSTVDRVSLQSHSSGSLDSMLNISNDEEIRAIMDRSSTHLDDTSDIIGSCNCPSSDGYGQGNGSHRLSLESGSTVGSSPAASTQNRLSSSSELTNQQPPPSPAHRLSCNTTNQNRFSNESGFVSMGNTRCSEISYSSFNSVMTQQQKTSLSFIDATPTPGDMPPSIADLLDEKMSLVPSPQSKTLGMSMANVVQQSMKHVSSQSSNFFEQNSTSSKSIGSNGKLSHAFSHSSSSSLIKEAEQRIESVKMEGSSLQSFSKTQKNVSQTLVIGGSLSGLKSNMPCIPTVVENGCDFVDSAALVPPALPVKTRKLKAGSQCDSLNESGLSSLNSTMDDQTIEYRDHSCSLHGHDGFIQRPHTLMDHTNQPPPLPLKKKHMFQSVAYSVMAYMEMFGNCSHSPQSSMEFLRHSVHAYNAVQHQHQQPIPGGHLLHTSHLQQMQMAGATHLSGPPGHEVHGSSTASFHQQNGQTTAMAVTQNGGQTIMTAQNGQAMAFSEQSTTGYNQMTQSHTLHQFSLSSTSSSQQISGFSSPLRSPLLKNDDSMKSSNTSTPTPTRGVPPPPPGEPAPPPPPMAPLPPPSPTFAHQLPPALPPKRSRTKPQNTTTSVPSKTSFSSGVASSPNTPNSACATPHKGRESVSPAPKFQFDPPPPVTADAVEDSLLMNVEDDSWQQSPNKPGKFPVDDLDMEQRTNASSSPSSRGEVETVTENEGEIDLILEMDVSNYLVKKGPGEEGPDIRGGHPDALIVHAIKSTKDFSYQEAFLTTYRTFVPPLQLIEKLNRRHAFLSRHGKHTKAREVQALLTRVVGDLTMADLDDEMLQLIMDFVYGLVCSGDLAMAKVLRVIILDKYKSKQALLQHQQQSYPGGCQAFITSARRDSVLEQKAEAVAEQMTLLDAELFTRIPPPEALLWARDQCEETSPNLTRFTEHFNKMSYWARSRILEQEEAKEREKYVSKFMKVMKHLRKMNNFNSYLALLSALDSAPIRRLEWQRHITEGLREYCALIDSSSSFRAYRQALAETEPPCIPYIGLVLQDLTFVHIGNNDLLPDGSVNFSKRWQQYHILENMKRFSKNQYTFKKNERIINMFNSFDDVLNEEAMWQISESIKPRGGRKTAAA